VEMASFELGHELQLREEPLGSPPHSQEGRSGALPHPDEMDDLERL